MIIPHDYCRLFSINVGTLKFFTQGVWSTLVQEITRFNKVVPDIDESDSQPHKKIRVETDTSQSTCLSAAQTNHDYHSCTLIREFLNSKI